MAPRRPASDLIRAVLDNMRNNLEPLRYSILAPSRYVIVLHPAEHARLEGILPLVRSETIRALEEEMRRLNRWTFVRRSFGRLVGHAAPIQSAGVDWQIEFLSDPDGELQEGDILIDSELRLPARPELGVGERTRRITTTVSGRGGTEVRRHEDNGHGGDAPRFDGGNGSDGRATQVPRHDGGGGRGTEVPRYESALARLSYEDRNGFHTYAIVKDSVTIGRGGIAYPVDVRVATSEDVSREHARIRRDPQSGRFFLSDLSLLGTSLNGRQVPRGYDDAGGTKRENGAETALPDRARIGLAETLYVEFERVR